MLEILDVSFAYEAVPVIKNISFSMTDGQQISIIGESGCGKSTLLKLIYGLYDTDSGRILYNRNPILGPKHKLIPGEDDFKYLAQDFGLMPFITAAENIGKFLSNVDKDKKRHRIGELLDLVGMSAYANVKTQFLSGGQQQRTALAMMLGKEPKLLLLDEPFSQIDAFRTNIIRRKLFAYCKQKNISCIVATHDPTDVLSFSDEAIVLRQGEIVQKGAPIDVYKKPHNLYVASLFGDANEIQSIYFKISGSTTLVYPNQQLFLNFQQQFEITLH